jgi:hypothetical protein
MKWLSGSGVAVSETVTPQGRGVRAYTDVFTACLRNSHTAPGKPEDLAALSR